MKIWRTCALPLLVSLCLGGQSVDRAIAVLPAAEALQEERVALVIGNGAYREAPLKNPAHDAQAMGRALEACGFQVTLLVDANRAAMFKAVREFGDRIRGGGVGLFYYAGHGMQVRGVNYLIPVGTDIEREDEVQVQALDVNAILGKLDSAGNRLNLLILDACRNNPFARSFRSGARGLSQMEAPSGTFVAFATAPGSTASDGGGENGLYTRHLLEALEQPGLSVEQVFKRVRVGVKRDSRDQQVPWDSSSLTGEFFFRPGGGAVRPMAPAAPRLAILEGASAQRALRKDGFESQAEYEARIGALPPLRLGAASLVPEGYDLATGRLPVVLTPEPWARPYVPSGKLYLELDRDRAKALCDLEARTGLDGRFAWVDGKPRCVGLELAAGALRYPVLRRSAYQIGDTEEVDLANGARLTLAFITPGSFRMGSQTGGKDERPVHEVTISRGFWMGATPVTQAQWLAVMGNNPSELKGAGPSAPVDNVSWTDCQQFIAHLNLLGRGTFRLPTEAEWEYACRAGSEAEAYGPLEAIAWYRANSAGSTHPVARKQPNAFGLHDMLGNIWQWVQDFKGAYGSAPQTDPRGATSGGKLFRGGSFMEDAESCRAAYRSIASVPEGKGTGLGFHRYHLGLRLVKEQP